MLFGIVSKNNYARNKIAEWIEIHIFRSVNVNQGYIPKTLSDSIEKTQFVALCKLNKYEERALQVNHIFRKRVLDELSNQHQKHVLKLNQLEKFKKIDQTIISNNGKAVKILIENFIKKNNMPILMDDIKNSDFLAPLSSLNETLTHLVRDYNVSFYRNETLPIVEYILNTISQNVKNFDSETTDILIPGSGLGRVSYEISKNFPDVPVTSVEYSDLMYIGNHLIYFANETINISPWVIEYSNHLSLEGQLKSFPVNCQDFTKPENLKIENADFRKYKLPVNQKQKKQLIIITVFFVDTAENIFEYMDKIESYKRTYETVHWINLGPLKYGTRPKVVLTAEEFSQLRADRGWKDIKYACSPEEEIGYVTNTVGLYKGKYSLLKFHSIL
ncbi:hypothetical protein QEN19_001434 [Hanseniaspora menglaensis]